MSMDDRGDDKGPKEENPGQPDSGSFEGEAFDAGVEEAKRLAEEEEAGYRHLAGWDKWVIPSIAFIWCLFQLSIASVWLLDTVIIRAVHLGFAMLIAFTSYPTLKKPRTGFWSFLSTRTRIPIFDYVMAIIACYASLYIFLDYEGIASRQGAPILRDVIVGAVLVLFLLEAARETGQVARVVGEVVDHAVRAGVEPGKKRRAARRTKRGRHEHVIEKRPLFGDSVEVGRLEIRMPGA